MKKITYKVKELCPPPKKRKIDYMLGRRDLIFNAALKKYGEKEVKVDEGKMIEICNEVADETNTGGKIFIKGQDFKLLSKRIASNLKFILKVK